MIGRLTGTVLAEEEDGLVFGVGGVGYEVMVPLGTIGRLVRDANDQTTLFVHTHVREDALSLYGFATLSDRSAFRTLIGVSSVGPRTALAILSALPAGDLAAAVHRKELAKLTAISGIGKKTAERLLLELRDKLPLSDAELVGTAAAGPVSTKKGELPPNGEVLHGTLTRLGYRPAEAERAVRELEARLASAPLADLVKEALAILAK
jgi:Holliday junction DNA helicase RuvA